MKSHRPPPAWIFIAAVFFFCTIPTGAFAQKIRVATLYIGSSMLPLWIAKEDGEFARRGLDVELIWLQSTLSTYALIAGEVDLIFGMKIQNPKVLDAAYQDGAIVQYPYMTKEQLNSSLEFSRRARE